MSRCWHGILNLVSVLIAVTAPLQAQAVLEPPYGLKWGDSPEKLISWAARQSLNVTISQPGELPTLRIIKIAPQKGFLKETRAHSIEGRFLMGKLFEVTVDFSDPDASADLMESRFEELRKQTSAEHGSLQPNQQQRKVEDQFVTRTQAFHREPVRGLFLLLAFTEVEDLLRKTKIARFSMIYRNENFRAEIMKASEEPKTLPKN